jgi:hypothetical protein
VTTDANTQARYQAYSEAIQDAEGRCALREETDCAPYAYLPLALEAVEGVIGQLGA